MQDLMTKQIEAHEASVARAAAEEQRLRSAARAAERAAEAAEADAEQLRAELMRNTSAKATAERQVRMKNLPRARPSSTLRR